MKTKEIKTNLGMVELGAIDILEDSVQAFFDVNSVSADLQKVIDKAIEQEKLVYLEKHKDCLREKKWCESGELDKYTSIRINVNDKKEVEAVLFVNFTDAEDECVWSSVAFDIDVSEHAEELKQMVVKAIVNKFF